MRFKEEIKWLVPLALVCVVVFANGVTGEFVYDDTRQIVRNTLIQDPAMIWRAVTSDVWAFKGDGTQAASNYWRPTFTVLNILCFRLFRLDPTGWHVVNIALHLIVTALSFLLLRKLNFSAAVSFVVALIFAVHPVHVESVTWIAGSPDLLFSIALLGSLWFADNYRVRRSNLDLFLMLVLYGAALGAKEIGILCLPIFFLVMKRSDEDGREAPQLSELNLPLLSLATLAAAYFLVRLSIIGAVAIPPIDAVPLSQAILSVPMMFAFYLKQILAPYAVAVNYSLEPVSAVSVGNFFLPLVVSAAAIAAIVYLARRSDRSRIAAALFFLPLLPAMNASAFPAEQMVHDRYLYLPLLGFLMLLVPLAAQFLTARLLVIAGAVIAAILAFQSFRYNSAWSSDLTLWIWTSGIDSSAFTSLQLGSALTDLDRHEEAITAYSKAIEKKPSMRAYYGRGRAYNALRQYGNAERDLAAALSTPKDDQDAYALYQVFESLGIAYLEQKKYEQGIRNFLEARKALPIYAAALTEKLAVVHYQAGNKSDAMRELEAYVVQSRREMLPESKNVVLRLGMLYAEAGRRDEARGALNEFLRSTASFNDKATLGYRNQAAKILQSLN